MALNETIQLARPMLLSVLFNGNTLLSCCQLQEKSVMFFWFKKSQHKKQHHADHIQTNKEDKEEYWCYVSETPESRKSRDGTLSLEFEEITQPHSFNDTAVAFPFITFLWQLYILNYF